MPATPFNTMGMPGLSLGISPSSSATANTGLDMLGGYGGAMTGAVNFGSGDTALSPVIKDVGTVIALVLGAMFLYRKLK